MAYFKVNNVDFSQYINSLNVRFKHNYNSQTNVKGDTIIDIISSKYEIEVGFIALNSELIKPILSVVSNPSVTVEFKNPTTGELTAVVCFIEGHDLNYYTIQSNKTLLNGFTLTFVQL